MTDLTRAIDKHSHWSGPHSIVEAVAEQYHLDTWADQKHRVEVWIEKQALTSVFLPPCQTHDVTFFTCRGYTSQSEMWAAAMRLKQYATSGQIPTILHFGDHDPSGLDMTRDIRERLKLFMGKQAGKLIVERVALNMDQIEAADPPLPPNPAKTTDIRFAGYAAEYGEESWELDALDAVQLRELVNAAILRYCEKKKRTVRRELQDDHRRELKLAADNWDELNLEQYAVSTDDDEEEEDNEEDENADEEE